MQKIKTEQPYKLYKKILKDRSKAKFAVLGIAVIIFVFLGLVVFVIESVEDGLDLEMLLALLFFMLVIPLIFYNPRLKAEYEPGVSYAYFRNYKKLTKKLPKALLYKEDQMRIENHQDVDFNVNVNLNAIYGVNDKLVMSYQNFDYEKQKMENGDYLLGVSAQGVYYVYKNKTVTKTKINFGDISTLGLLVCPGNIYVFHIISIQNDEISIIVDQDDSLMVSPIMMFGALLKLLDDYILNDGAVSNSSSKRRRVSVSPEANTETRSNVTEPQEMSNKRVVDISYSTGVLEEMKTATYVGSRQIEIDTPVPTEAVREESKISGLVEPEKREVVSNRSVDLDDIIGSRIADVRRNIVIESETSPVPIVPIYQSQSETPDRYQKEEIREPATPREKVHETKELMEEQHESEISKEKTQSQEIPKEVLPKEEEPKEKRNTGLIIGIVAAVVVIAVLAVLFLMKGKKDNKTSEKQFAVGQQAQNEAELADQVLDAYKTHEIYNLETSDFQSARKAASAVEEASGSICIDWDYYYCTQDDYPDRFDITRVDFIDSNKANVYVELIFDREIYKREGNYFTDNVVLTMVRDFESVWLVDDVWHGGNSIKQEMIECTRDLQGEIMSNTSSNITKVYSNAYDGFVNIRQAPESKAPILGVLRNGPEGAILLDTEGEWKKIDCNGIVGYVYGEYVQDTPTEIFEYWAVLRKDASNYRFTENDLSPLTAKELTYLRYSIYAKHGYIFNSQELNNYFKQISWYHPNAGITEAALNSVEKANVEFIRNYQERNGKTYEPNNGNDNKIVVIDGSELRLRLDPSTSSDTFKWPDGTNRHPKVGERFMYLGESDDFYKIDFNGYELWVSKQFSHIE